MLLRNICICKVTVSCIDTDATECIVCESAVQYVQALIQENATVAQIEAVLEKICNFLPDKIKSEVGFAMIVLLCSRITTL